MSKVATRLITIDHRGPIPQKSGIAGPITRPYREDVRVIARMLIGRISVVEHFEDGSTKKLSLRDIPELTAQAPAIVIPNKVQTGERARVQALVDQAKAELKDRKGESAAEPVTPVKEVKPEPVKVEKAPAKTVDSDPNVAAMTKAERKAYYAKKREEEEAVKAAEAAAAAASNERIEEVLETK